MGYAFISYSTKNQTAADALKRLFDKCGINSWMAPGDIPAGSKYAQVINKAIKDCDCVVLLLTDASQNSTWVSKEIERAINYKKTIVPIQLEDVVLNDEFEFYISTDQIVAVQMIDEESAEIKKVLDSVAVCCGCQLICKDSVLENQSTGKRVSEVQYRISFSRDSGSLFLYSIESLSKENALEYTVSEEEWNRLSNAVKRVIALLFDTKDDFVSITLHDVLENKKCAPLDGHSYYDAEFRINFGIQSLGGNNSKIYDSAHIDVGNEVNLSFFKTGNYIYKTVSTDSTLTDLGVDEAKCIKTMKELLECLHPNKTIITAEHFYTKIYSDLSGGFKLGYIVK